MKRKTKSREEIQNKLYEIAIRYEMPKDHPLYPWKVTDWIMLGLKWVVGFISDV